MIKAVIFDFDGTVSNRQKNAYDTFDLYVKDIFKDLNEMEYEAVMQDFLTDDCNGTINCKFRLAPFIDKYKDRLPENFEADFVEYYYAHMGDFTELKKDFYKVLTEIKKNYKTAVLTNGNSNIQRAKIGSVGIEELLDEIIVSGEIGVNKPNKEVFEIMADRLGVKCEECMFVGDVFSTDILGAIRSNMVPVWIVTDYERPAKYYKGYRIKELIELFDILQKEQEK